MTISAEISASQTAVIGTEYLIASPSTAGVYTFHVDMVNMASGDFLELRVYQTVLSGGTSRVAYFETYQGAQPTDGLIAISAPISNDLAAASALRFSLKQTFGTGRNFPFKILFHS